MQEFTKKAIKFRKTHLALTNEKYYSGHDDNHNGFKDVTWIKADATEPDGQYFDMDMKLPANLPGKHWYLAADTSEKSEIKGNFAESGYRKVKY